VPVVVQVQPGDVIQFVVREGLHTVTAYHPNNRLLLRIPNTAESFDSGLLKAGDTWFLTVETEGVYDYFCLPHERIGHAGRILSGSVKSIPNYPKGQIPEAALKKLNTETTSVLTNQHN
jgi:plastocyanin